VDTRKLAVMICFELRPGPPSAFKVEKIAIMMLMSLRVNDNK
jgi:hypothetical protein